MKGQEMGKEKNTFKKVNKRLLLVMVEDKKVGK